MAAKWCNAATQCTWYRDYHEYEELLMKIIFLCFYEDARLLVTLLLFCFKCDRGQ